MAIDLSGGMKLFGGFASAIGSYSSAMSSASDVRAMGSLEAEALRLQGLMEKQAYDLNALINTDNASLALINAGKDYQDAEKAADRMVGTARNELANSGVNISTGSPLLVLSTLASEGALEAVKLKYRGLNEARNFRNEAVLQTFYGKQAEVTGQIRAETARVRSEMQANSIERQARQSLFDGFSSLAGSLF